MSNLNQFIGLKQEDSASASGDLGMPMLAIRQSADTVTTDADGDYSIPKLDEEGRLKVSSKPASYPDITGDITAIQATINTPVAGGTVAGDVSRASNVMMFCTGTFNTVNCSFEGSLEATGDANWFSVQAIRTNANTIETTTGNLSAQPTYAWELSVNGLKRVRVRCTARTSGTQSWRFVLGTYATEPIPAAQVSATQPVSMTALPALAAGTNLAGNFQLAGRTTSTLTAFRIKSAAGTNATAVKGSAGSVYKISLFNAAASTITIKFYNKATAPVAGTDNPLATFPIPANTAREIDLPLGLAFSLGIGYAITANRGDGDTTGVAADDLYGLVMYV